jgi:hypothetical protein
MAYNSTNFWAYKPLIHSYSTLYRSGEKTGGLEGCPPGNTSAKERLHNQLMDFIYLSPLKLKASRAYPPTIYSPRSDPSKTDGGSKGVPP